MPVLMPFESVTGHRHKGDDTSCPTFRALSKKLQKEAKKNKHLWAYLHSFPIDELGVPEFHESVDRKLGELLDPNLIYPVSDLIYIHILADKKDARNYYIAVEPGMAEDLSDVIDETENRLVDFVNDLDTAEEDDKKRSEILLKSLSKICKIHKGKGSKPKNNGKLILTRKEFDSLRYLIVRDKEGMGPLDPLIYDPHIEDISCSGMGSIFVEHKIFHGLKSTIAFDTTEELDSFVIRLSEKIGKPVTFRDPVVDATLPDGSRINIVFGIDLSKRGSNFTIRKFASTPLSILQLCAFGTLTYEMAAYLSLALAHGMNMFISGETASGKTTLLNALTTFIPPNGKIVSIEDTPELQVPHKNWCREVTRGSSKTSSGSAVDMFDLLKAALRQRPNEIIIGEIRGAEGAIAFQAMQTGHACMATFHAASVEKLIQRLTGNPINIPKTYVDNLNVVAIQSAVRLPSGKEGRRVISVNEIVGYDSSSDSFSFIEVFRWNPTNDTHEFSGYMNSYMLEERISLARGIPPHKKRTIYEELTRRPNILKKLQEQKKDGFDELHQILSQAYREGVFR